MPSLQKEEGFTLEPGCPLILLPKKPHRLTPGTALDINGTAGNDCCDDSRGVRIIVKA